MAQIVDTDIVPSATGQDLGSAAKRWDAFVQNLDVSGTITSVNLTGATLALSSTTTDPISITTTGASTRAINITATNSANNNIVVSTDVTGSAAGVAVLGSGATGIGFQATVSGASALGVQSIATAAGATAIQAYGTNASTKLFSGKNSVGVEKFSVANTGAITTSHGLIINGATEITAQTGTGGTVVMSASPTLTGTLTAATVTASGTVTGNVFTSISGTTVAMLTAAIGAGASSALVTQAFSGALSTDVVMWSPVGDWPTQYQKGLFIIAYATANNVNFRVVNPTAGSLTPDALTLNVRIMH